MTLLAACDGSHPPIGAPGATRQIPPIPTQAERGSSWMLLEAKSDDLLYVGKASYPSYGVSVYSRR